MIVGTPCRMMVLVTGWTRIWALSGTCFRQTTMCMVTTCLSALSATGAQPRHLVSGKRRAMATSNLVY
jgi:hypothetical protein